jgi:hypothetical protein
MCGAGNLQFAHYIRLYPVRGKWRLSDHWEDYDDSSARFYVKNIAKGFVPCIMKNYPNLERNARFPCQRSKLRRRTWQDKAVVEVGVISGSSSFQN